MSIKFESAKAKLEFAQSTGTTAVLEAEEAATVVRKLYNRSICL